MIIKTNLVIQNTILNKAETELLISLGICNGDDVTKRKYHEEWCILEPHKQAYLTQPMLFKLSELFHVSIEHNTVYLKIQ